MYRVVMTGVLLSGGLLNAAVVLQEGFDNVAGLAGWTLTNNSDPLGSTGWFQGNPGVFGAHSGAPDSYIGANFENAGLGGDISNWLLTPVLTLQDGDVVTFYTRSQGTFQDRLEVRLNPTGTTNVGTTDTSVGDFTVLLTTVNPLLDSSYPTDWTQVAALISGLGGPANVTLGFRYFVPDTNTNADYIGIDTLTIDSQAVPEPSTLLVCAAALAGLALRRRRLR